MAMAPFPARGASAAHAVQGHFITFRARVQKRPASCGFSFVLPLFFRATPAGFTPKKALRCPFQGRLPHQALQHSRISGIFPSMSALPSGKKLNNNAAPAPSEQPMTPGCCSSQPRSSSKYMRGLYSAYVECSFGTCFPQSVLSSVIQQRVPACCGFFALPRKAA